MTSTFEITAKDLMTEARAGLMTTPHGSFNTPVFMPVGTQGTVKALTQEMLEAAGAGIILGNTYHLYLRPGHSIINRMGGLHSFISWDRAILTDSGGYQVFSLGPMRKVTEEGVEFQSHIDGSRHLLTPEKSMEIQIALGADIVMAFDECTSYPASHEEASKSLELTERWAARSMARFRQIHSDEALCAQIGNKVVNDGQAIFGINQGSVYIDLRERSLEGLLRIGFDGYAIGGLSVGEEKKLMFDVVRRIAPQLPSDRPRYLMGVGMPEDIVEAVSAGVDMFDCVVPTRNARNGQLFTNRGKMNIKNSRYKDDQRPIDEECECNVCSRYSRAYIRHLYFAGEILGSVLATSHNVRFYLDTMSRIRQSIQLGTFFEFRDSFLNGLSRGQE